VAASAASSSARRLSRDTWAPLFEGGADFTHADEPGVTIAGQPFPHLLYHFVMVYSRQNQPGGQHVGVVLCGESFTALAENLAPTPFGRPPDDKLGGVPQNHRTDSLSFGGQKVPRTFH